MKSFLEKKGFSRIYFEYKKRKILIPSLPKIFGHIHCWVLWGP